MMNYIFLVLTVVVNWFVIGVACSIFTKEAEIWSVIITGIIIALAVSPLAEWIIRQFYGCRPATKEENEIIERAWLLVNQAVKEDLPQEPELYVSDQKFPNAFAIGRKTICVTRGLLLGAGTDELAGVLAHEMGHLHYGDSRHRSIVVAMNMAGNIASIVLIVFVSIIGIFDRKGLGLLLASFALLLKGILWVLNKLIDMGHLVIGRKEELRADEYAKALGFGAGLKKYLKKVEKLDVAPIGLWAALSRTHPPIAARIERLTD